MSDAQVKSVESSLPEIGATIGSVIPGIGTVIGGAVGALAEGVSSLFGPSVHTTASGMTYDQASDLLLDQELTINSLYQQIYGKPLDPVIPPRVGNAAEWSYESGLVARYLKNPSLQSPDPKNWDKLKGDGSIDAAIQTQKTVMSQLQAMLDQQAADAVSASAPASAAGGALASVTSNPMMLLLAIAAAILVLRN